MLHASVARHRYPMHAHDTWAVLIVDRGAIRYDLDRYEHVVAHDVSPSVTLLPPHVPHNGCAAGDEGFRKRVLYLDGGELDERLIGRSVDSPAVADHGLWRQIDALHRALGAPDSSFESESRLAVILERLRGHLRPASSPPPGSATTARRLRDLLEAAHPDGVSLRDAAATLGFHPAHLVRSFTGEFGLAPHQYVISRRVDHARHLLLQGASPADAAVCSGFHDQPHLGRHFKRIIGTGPGAFGGARRGRPAQDALSPSRRAPTARRRMADSASSASTPT